ncbi:hypothetical protein SOCE26_068660 [Sorangium cellulosum]|uniref:Gingipain domain-containing protein n=1 Tax=Sorangium cellulosum TaxID=56 RepID=A0A2L0F1E2_SORCE|nr:hypothetical protein [Sorangium cellulosum]AUX45384.1 hypothetical protein SOCE26_068660 [Sorangium cellulosum]
MNIELLLAHADDHRPILAEGIPPAALSAAPRPAELPLPTHLRYDAADPESLPDQRWGVIAPEGPAGDRLLGAVAPLCQARREAQGADVRVYRVPAGMGPVDAARWKEEVYWDRSVREEDLPRYLLILGDADQVSWDLQLRLASDTFIGRVAFAAEAGYAAYADKVLRWERAEAAAAARAVFLTVRDGTAATTLGHEALMKPTLELASARKAEGVFPASEIVAAFDDVLSPLDALLEHAARREPGMLFTISHGIGAPRGGWKSLAEQRALQGAMALGLGQRLAAEDLRSRPFLPGGVWFLLACYGAGTPSVSAYRHWLERMRAAGQYAGRVDAVLAGLPAGSAPPFVAALPQAALENPDGPLAVIGHVDLAWTYSFQDAGAPRGSRPARFQGIFRALADGGRAGVAYHELLRFFAETSVELTTLDNEDARAGAAAAGDAELARKAHLWMLRNDLAGYVLLGDPAARLPIARTPGRPRPPATLPDVQAIVGFKLKAERKVALDPRRMEEAVLELLGEPEAQDAIADRVGISRSELRRWADIYRDAGRAALAKIR